MAKRKRASLKDKSSESLGRAPKKGKGIDLLFGGSADQQEAGAAAGSNVDLGNLDDSGSNAAPATIGNQGLVDELGLPVALEAPPDDLILASSSPAGSPEDGGNDLSGGGENLSNSFDENDLSGILDGGTLTDAVGADDLSGLVEDDLSGLVEGDLSGLAGDDLSGLVDDTMAASDDLSGLVVDDTAGGDLSGLVDDTMAATDDLSGLVVDDIAPADDLSGLVVEDAVVDDMLGLAPGLGPDVAAPQTFPTSGLPPTTAAPLDMSSPAGTFPDASSMPTPPGTVPNIMPPSTATGAPDMARSGPIKIEALDEGVVETLGVLGEALGSKEDFSPDAANKLFDKELTVIEDEPSKLDNATRERVLQYLGSRRDDLFERIQGLHDRVAEELSGNKEDVSFALATLRDANEAIIVRPYEYDEALYRVALVETMLHRKRKLNKSSRGLVYGILVYGIFFTAACLIVIALTFKPETFVSIFDATLGPIFLAAWFSGLAGGIGGCVEVFWRLYYRVSIKQDFDKQYLMYYLVKPILGFVLGLVMYFLVAVGSSMGGATELPEATGSVGFSLAILLGIIAGYRQEAVFDMIYVVVNRISPDRKKGMGAKSVVPIDAIKPADTSADGAAVPATSS